MNEIIYLDNNATTALDPIVAQAVIDELSQVPSNPSSVHRYGRSAQQRLIKARDSIAHIFNVKPDELLFTSSGTEALHHLIYSLCSNREKGHIITSDMEHAAVYATMQHLQSQGYSVTFLKGSSKGSVDVDAVQQAIKDNTCLIALMSVNNETGVKTDIDSIAKLAQKHSIPFLVDGISQLGKEKILIPQGVVGMAFSGHKIHAPKGVGLAFLRKPFRFLPIFKGGHQEFDARAGTENLSGIIGMAKAIEILNDGLPDYQYKMQKLRDHFEKELKNRLSDVIINGQGLRICNVSNLTFLNVDGESLLVNLDRAGILASMGSACSSGAIEPSRTLLNMGLTTNLAKSSLRFSLSRMTTKENIDQAIELITSIVNQMRN
ncbi:MAG: cysteine desulfurase [Parachlamydiales bacterium]|nr:cysteine desulfurase [Parachlamydiales bacterium]